MPRQCVDRKRVWGLASALLVVGGTTQAQVASPTLINADTGAPTETPASVFAKYPAKPFVGPKVPMRITPKNRHYRTLLRALGETGELNFGGHYAIDVHGCGGGCIAALIYNAKTGFGGLLPHTYSDCYTERHGYCMNAFEYEPSSRLFVATGRRTGHPERCEVVHYVIDGNRWHGVASRLAWD